MKFKIYLLAFTALFIFQLQAQWNPIDSITQGNIQCLHFTNADTGFVYNEPGIMRRTTNGGQSWDTAGITFSGFVEAIDFANASVGYAVGGAWFPFGTHYPLAILKTVDGGLSWDSIFSGSSHGVFSHVEAISPTELYVAGDMGMLHSTDGGQSFDTVSVDNQPWGTEQYGRIHFLNASHGYVMSRSNFFTGHLVNLYETTDGGKNWVSIHEDTTTNFTNDFVMTAAGNGVIVGNDSYVMRTTNGGANWQKLPLAQSLLTLYQLQQVGGHLYALGSDGADTSSGLYRSTDWGASWQKLHSQKSGAGSIMDMSIPTRHTGYFATWNTVYKNEKLVSLMEPAQAGFELFPNPANEVLTIQFSENGTAAYQVYNLQGQRVLQGTFNKYESNNVDVKKMKPGIYILQVQQGGQHFRQRFVKK